MAYTEKTTTAAPADPPTRTDNIGQVGVVGGAGTGWKFPNTGNETWIIHNTAANTPGFTILASGTKLGAPLDESNDIVVAGIASASWYIGRLNPEIYNDADGYVRIYFDDANAAELKVLVWRNG